MATTTTDGLEEAEAEGGTPEVGEGDVISGGGTAPTPPSPTDCHGDEETADDPPPLNDVAGGCGDGEDRADDDADADTAAPPAGEGGGGPVSPPPGGGDDGGDARAAGEEHRLTVETAAAPSSAAAPDAVNKAFSPDARAAEAGSYKERRQRELDELRKQKLAQKLREGLSNAMLELSQEDEQTRIELLRARQAELEELRKQKLTQSRSTDLSQAASETELAAEEERIRIELLQLEAVQRAAQAEAERAARAKEEELERERSMLIEAEMKQKNDEEDDGRERTEDVAAEEEGSKEDEVPEEDESQAGAAVIPMAEEECPGAERSGSDDGDDGADAEVEVAGVEVVRSATEEGCVAENEPEAEAEAETETETETEAKTGGGNLSEDQRGGETRPPGDAPEPELEPEPSGELMEKLEAEPLREVEVSQEECVASNRKEEGEEDKFATANDEAEVAEMATALKSLSLEDDNDASPGGEGEDTPTANPDRGGDAKDTEQVTVASVQSSTEGDAIADDQPPGAEAVNMEEGEVGVEEACEGVQTDVADAKDDAAEETDSLDDADAAVATIYDQEATTRCQLEETEHDDTAVVDKAGTSAALEATTPCHSEKDASGPASSLDQMASMEEHHETLTEDHADTRLNSEEQRANDSEKSGPDSDQNPLVANGGRECSKETPMLQGGEVQEMGIGSIEEIAVTLKHGEEAHVDAAAVSEVEKGKKWKSAVPEYVKFRTSNASAGFDRAYYAS